MTALDGRVDAGPSAPRGGPAGCCQTRDTGRRDLLLAEVSSRDARFRQPTVKDAKNRSSAGSFPSLQAPVLRENAGMGTSFVAPMRGVDCPRHRAAHYWGASANAESARKPHQNTLRGALINRAAQLRAVFVASNLF